MVLLFSLWIATLLLSSFDASLIIKHNLSMEEGKRFFGNHCTHVLTQNYNAQANEEMSFTLGNKTLTRPAWHICACFLYAHQSCLAEQPASERILFDRLPSIYRYAGPPRTFFEDEENNTPYEVNEAEPGRQDIGLRFVGNDPANVTAHRGEDIRLVCTVYSKFKPLWKWYFHSSSVDLPKVALIEGRAYAEIESEFYEIRHNQSTSEWSTTLTVDSAIDTDTGWYLCTATVGNQLVYRTGYTAVYSRLRDHDWVSVLALLLSVVSFLVVATVLFASVKEYLVSENFDAVYTF